MVVGFEVSLGALLGALAVYWTQLMPWNMFDTLTYMAGLTLPAVFFGHRVLRAVHAAASKEKRD